MWKIFSPCLKNTTHSINLTQVRIDKNSMTFYISHNFTPFSFHYFFYIRETNFSNAWFFWFAKLKNCHLKPLLLIMVNFRRQNSIYLFFSLFVKKFRIHFRAICCGLPLIWKFSITRLPLRLFIHANRPEKISNTEGKKSKCFSIIKPEKDSYSYRRFCDVSAWKDFCLFSSLCRILLQDIDWFVPRNDPSI